MAYKVGMVSLGCSKNQVDAEILLALMNCVQTRSSVMLSSSTPADLSRTQKKSRLKPSLSLLS